MFNTLFIRTVNGNESWKVLPLKRVPEFVLLCGAASAGCEEGVEDKNTGGTGGKSPICFMAHIASTNRERQGVFERLSLTTPSRVRASP